MFRHRQSFPSQVPRELLLSVVKNTHSHQVRGGEDDVLAKFKCGCTRRFAPRAAYAARYDRSGRKSTSNYYAKRIDHDWI